MPSIDQPHMKRISIVALCLITLGLLFYPAASLYAQDAENGDALPAQDDASSIWQSPETPEVPKPDAATVDADDVISPEDAKKQEQFGYTLYLPDMSNDGSAEAAATTAAWRTLLNETFEGTYFPPPNSNWAIRDHNGPAVGVKLNEFATLVWDDNSTRAYAGSWSANPNDGAWAPSPGASPTYANFTDTWMRYGPLNLVGATDAKFVFQFWLDTETYYDFFTWEYSCTNNGNWVGESRSGKIQQWRAVSVSLASCLGSSNVYIRYWFRSDYSNPSTNAPTGVWIDNIRVLAYR